MCVYVYKYILYIYIYVYISVATNIILSNIRPNVFVRIFVRASKKNKIPAYSYRIRALTNIFEFVRIEFLKNWKYSNSFDFNFFFEVSIFGFVRMSMEVFSNILEYGKNSKNLETNIRCGKIYYIRSNIRRIMPRILIANIWSIQILSKRKT